MRETRLNATDGKQSFRLVLGDAMEVLDNVVDAGEVDVIVTSPPYNIGVRYGKYDDTLPRDEYLRWVDDWTGKLSHLLGDAGSFFLNVGAKPTDPWVPFEIADVVRRHFKLQNVIHWVKSIAIDGDSQLERGPVRDDIVVGHYKPIQSKRFLSDLHEYVFHWTKTGFVELDRLALGVPYKDKSNVSRWKAGAADRRCRGNVWFVPYETIQNRSAERPHPSTFPPRLARMCIRLHGRARTRLVLDPFMGIGSTALACLRESVAFVGIEIDDTYLEEAEHRLRNALDAP